MHSRKLIVSPVDERQRRLALDRFKDYLNRDPLESEWQDLFDANPFVLTETLPIRFDVICSQVPLVSGKPDYVFWRGYGPLGDVGVIELKRSGQSIIGSYSSKIVYPSRHLSVAEKQAKQYLASIERGEFLSQEDYFLAGNRRHAFIILGNSREILKKCRSEIISRQFRNLLPQGFYLFTYNEICDLFAATIKPRIQVLCAKPPFTVIETVEMSCSQCNTPLRVPAALIRDFGIDREPISGEGYFISRFGGIYCDGSCYHLYLAD